MVHSSGFDPYVSTSKGKLIEARSERQVFLFFNGDTDYVDSAYQSFQAKCLGGEIVGVTTEFQTALQPFSYLQKIIMKGWCLKG